MNTSKQFVSLNDLFETFKLMLIKKTFISVPTSPHNMSIEKITSNSVMVRWNAPEGSLFTEFSIRYRTESDKQWIRLPSVGNSTEADVTVRNFRLYVSLY